MTPHRFRFVAMLLFAPAIAFSASTDDSAIARKPEEKKDEPVKLESVEVTGSRIRTLVGEQTAIPVLTFDQIELEQRGVSRLADIRWAIPQLGPSVGFNDNLQNSGTSRAQTVSTSFALRGVSGNSTLVLIDGHRVPHTGQEAPGGAGGREDFNIDGIPVSAIERIEILPQGAGAIYGSDAITGVVNIILKKNFKGNELQFSYDNSFDTDVAAKTATLTGGYSTGKLSLFYTFSQTEQDSLAARDRWWSKTNDLTPYGASYNYNIYGPYSGAGTLANGFYPYSSTTIYSIPTGSKGSFTTSQATSGASTPLYDSAPYTTLIDPSRSRSAIVKANFDFASWLHPYLQARYNDTRTYLTGTPITLITQLPANANGNPFSVPLYLGKVFYDLPLPSTISEQKNTGLIFGASGDLPGDWRYDASFSWARNVVSDEGHNVSVDFSKLSAAVASGVILTYDSSVAGTDPNAAGVIQSLLSSGIHEDTTDVYQYSAQTDGAVWTGWAGDIRAAVGGEFQREKIHFYRTPAISYLLSKPFQREVSAAFGELALPLLSDRQHIPLVHRVEVTGAARAEHFSDLGNRTSPSLNALYQPAKWLTFRAARTTGFKAPKLYDLLAPNYATTTTITASRGIKDTLRNNEAVVGTYTLTTGGQPHLKPESSVSRNVGAVLDVPFVKGLSFSIDFWTIDYKDQVSAPGYQDLITFFPERVTRNSSNVITGFDNSVINQSKVQTKGVDYRGTYEHAFSFGRMMFSASVADEGEVIATATPSAKPTHRIMPLKGSSSVFWSHGSWTGGVAVNYQGRYQPYAGATTLYPSYIEWNPQASYDFGNHVASDGAWGTVFKDIKLTATVVNLFNKDPDTWDVGNGRIVMDPRLRRYILTLSKKF